MSKPVVKSGRFTKSQGTNGNAIADRNRGDSGTDFGDRSGCLVANDLRFLNALIHRTVKNMDVRATDSTERDIESYFTRARRDRLTFADRNRVVALVLC